MSLVRKSVFAASVKAVGSYERPSAATDKQINKMR